MREILHAKIQSIRVTKASLDYEGSITLDPELMERVYIREFDFVMVNNKETGFRGETYVISGEPGDCQINGALAHHFSEGDEIHILAKRYANHFQKADPNIIEKWPE